MWPWISFLIFIGVALASDPVTQAIDSSRQSILKKNRVEACGVLVRALQSGPLAARSRAKLTESLNQMATLFFTDNGQRSYEAAQAVIWDTPDVALAQLKAAAEQEDSHLLILEAMARGYLFKGDCDLAQAALKTARSLHPYALAPALLEVRAAFCANQLELAKEKLRALPPVDKANEFDLWHLQAREALLQKSFHRAADLAQKVIEAQPQFTESYWVLSRAQIELGRDTAGSLEKYLSLCKALTAKERKQFAREPRACVNMKEAEGELAKLPKVQ